MSEYRLQSVAPRHRKDGNRYDLCESVLSLLALLRSKPFALLVHVLHTDTAHAAQRARIFQNLVRNLGMHMHFHERRVANNDCRATASAHLHPHTVNIQSLASNDELSAVSVLFVFSEVKKLKRDARLRHVNALGKRHVQLIRARVIARHPAPNAFKNHPQPQAARIDYARLLKSGQQSGSNYDGFPRRIADARQHIIRTAADFSALHCGVCCVGEHRQHSAFDRIADGIIGMPPSETERYSKVMRTDSIFSVERLGHTFEELGYYGTAVALRPHARPVPHRFCDRVGSVSFG